ncbi:hypothetical protein [Nannocystis pusilla]|uniref:hypothetical protein n=1 Tax=Nannocystis pusilla TaxID=889268 RepID=UPI003DA3F8EA
MSFKTCTANTVDSSIPPGSPPDRSLSLLNRLAWRSAHVLGGCLAFGRVRVPA